MISRLTAMVGSTVMVVLLASVMLVGCGKERGAVEGQDWYFDNRGVKVLQMENIEVEDVEVENIETEMLTIEEIIMASMSRDKKWGVSTPPFFFSQKYQLPI